MIQEKRYDRQLRLWEEDGQIALEKSHVCLVYASAVGTEALKNLVLPGIGAITILDPTSVAGHEMRGSNFFLEPLPVALDSMAELPRGKEILNLLLEMNDQVSGSFDASNPCDVISKNLSYFDKFSLVIVADYMESQYMEKLASYLWNRNTPLILTRSIGFLGYMRIIAKSHYVLHPRLMNPVHDLRINHPFPELAALIDETESLLSGPLSQSDPSSSSDVRFHRNHLPYLLILCQALKKWRLENENTGEPESSDSKASFKTILASILDQNEITSETRDEALSKSFLAFKKHGSLSSQSKTLISEDKSGTTTFQEEKSSHFWILTRALGIFVEENNGLVPLAGSLPDMHSSTEWYTRLHSCFHEKSVSDLTRFTAIVKDQLKLANLPEDNIPTSIIKMYCKHANHVACLRGVSLAQELEKGPMGLSNLLDDLDNPAHFYVCLLASNEFVDEFKRFPGIDDNEFDGDFRQMKRICNSILNRWNCRRKADAHSQSLVRDDVLSQFVKYGFSELHPMCAFMGGIVSQEAIKILTNQYVPSLGTFLYVGLNTPIMATFP